MVALRRFYFPELSSELQEQTLTGLSRHLSVLRVSDGDVVVLFDGKGRTRQATLQNVGDVWSATFEHPIAEVTVGRPINLVVSLPKGKKLESIVRMATEAGVHHIHPVLSEHSVVTPEPSRFEKRRPRLQRIAEEAARQSERLYVPEVQPLRTLAETLCAVPSHASSLALVARSYEGASENVDVKGSNEVWVFVGPEGGFSKAEREQFVSAGVKGWWLFDSILRVETACVVAVAILRRSR